ncbi:MAG: tetratricopeptide repeat protein, partial [Candidatus Omnitrophota bacterium]
MKLRYKHIILTITILLAAICPAHAQYEEGDILFATRALNDGFYDLAVGKLQTFLKKNPESTHKNEAYILLGKCYYNQNQFTKSIYEFEQVINDPKAADLWDDAIYWTGEVYFKINDYNKAIECYDKIVKDYKDSPFLAFSYYSMGWC